MSGDQRPEWVCTGPTFTCKPGRTNHFHGHENCGPADAQPPTAPSGEHGDTVSVPKAEWDALVEAVDKGAGRMGHRWIVPIGDRATALVGASRRQAATEGGAS